jgi:hypothetical protein
MDGGRSPDSIITNAGDEMTCDQIVNLSHVSSKLAGPGMSAWGDGRVVTHINTTLGYVGAIPQQL